ncbi:hypothetical protein ANN_02531 [Periplaneta americana]|uniref:Uncharacterized protein n=1 Tax=Periplaneta americana TaxID=6978 RepID=A0ABQ8TWS4_PERAM|nr:hypothetical protein ANN_02531 [Periplaneta americana]
MSPGSNTESYPAFAHIGLRENPEKPQPVAICLFEHIEQRFLLSGHSFLQCDSDFALIEKRQNVTKAFIPSDLLKILQDSKVVKPFQTVSMLESYFLNMQDVADQLISIKNLNISKACCIQYDVSKAGSTLKKKSPGRNSIALRLSEATVRSRALRLLSLGPFEGAIQRCHKNTEMAEVLLRVQFKVCHGSLYAVMWLADEPREFNLPSLPQRRITYVPENCLASTAFILKELIALSDIFSLLSFLTQLLGVGRFYISFISNIGGGIIALSKQCVRVRIRSFYEKWEEEFFAV